MSENINRLYHYTSFEAFVHIFDYQLDCVSNHNMIDLRFGNPVNMNDKNEIAFFEKFFFTGSKISNEIAELYTKLKKKMPFPYIFSLIHHVGSKWYPKDEIPMWFMYGGKATGVRIAFDFKQIEKFCENNNYLLKECQYVNQGEMKDIASNCRERIKKTKREDWNEALKKTYIDSLCYKTKDWTYEQEYRIVACGNNDKTFRICPEEKYKYLHVAFPLKAVKEVTIGPLADKIVANRCIELLTNELFSKVSSLKAFDIKVSKLQIR